MTPTKVCNKCGVERPLTSFYKQQAAPDGCGYTCKDCCLKRERRYRYNNPKKFILKRARSRARKGDIPFNITDDDFAIPKRCPVFDIPLVINKDGYGGHGGWTDNSPSLDRIIPDLGYVRGNVEVVSMKANRLKNDVPIGDLITLARYYAAKFNTEF